MQRTGVTRRRGATGALVALLISLGCTADRRTAPSEPGETARVASCRGDACLLATDARALRAAAHRTSTPGDSAATPLSLGSVIVHAEAGDAIVIRGTADAAVLAAIGPAASLLVRHGDGETRHAIQSLIGTGRVVYRFDETATVELGFALTGVAAPPHAGAFALAIESSARVTAGRALWAGRLGPMPALEAEPDCVLSAPSGTCEYVTYTISPYAVGNLGTFQSQPGTGASSTITLAFSTPVSNVTVEIQDPTYAGNTMAAFDSTGTQIGSVGFAFSGAPGTNQPDVKTLHGRIASVVLTPASADYVAYNAWAGVAARQLRVTCTPSPVVRGAEVECVARLNTGEAFSASIVSASALGTTFQSVPQAIEQGRAARSRGTAAVNGPVTFYAAVAGPEGPISLEGTGQIQVEARSGFASPGWPSAVNVVWRGLKGTPTGSDPPDLGGTERPKMDLGSGTAIPGSVPIGSGPQTGVAYLAATPAFTPGRVFYHEALSGYGKYFQDQNGLDASGATAGPLTGLPYCTGDDMLQPVFWDVRRHEGADGSSPSHVAIWTTVMSGPDIPAFFEQYSYDSRGQQSIARTKFVWAWEMLSDVLGTPANNAFHVDEFGGSWAPAYQRFDCELDNSPGD